MLLIFPVHATQWVGNDNGEFESSNGWPTYMAVRADITAQLSSSTPQNSISLQYNPDRDYSFCCQRWGDWFQAGIISDLYGNCPSFTLQVYDTFSDPADPNYDFDWRTDFPAAGAPCQQVSGLTAAGASWYVEEDVGNNQISQVYFDIRGTGCCTMNRILYPQTPFWYWLKSNVCWCGVSGVSTTFTNGYGSLTYSSDKNFRNIDPPVDLSTTENSNMPYTQFSGVGTTSMSQLFGWPPPCCGGGGGGGSVAPGTLITMSDGSQHPVQTLTAGDSVIVYDVYSGTSMHATIAKMLSVTRDNRVTIYTQGNPPLRVDDKPDFYVWTTNGPLLKPVTMLQSGDLLYSYYQSSWIPVTNVTVNYGGSYTYYDLITNPQFNNNGRVLSFVANGIADPCIPSCPLGPSP